MLEKIETAFEARAQEIYEKHGFNAYGEFDNNYNFVVEIWLSDHILYQDVFTDIDHLFEFLDRVANEGIKAL